MDIGFLEDMVSIALKQNVVEETVFANTVLEQETLRLGCIRILEWLRIQSVALRKNALTLKTTSKLDVACRLLIETTDFLPEFFNVKGNRLTFAEGVTIDRAKVMMIYAKENYRPPVFSDKSNTREKP